MWLNKMLKCRLFLLQIQIQSLNDMYKRLQEYNTSLQQYNSKLQSELAATNETLKRVEKEKNAVLENLSTLRGHYTSLQEQLTSSRVSASDLVSVSFFWWGSRLYFSVLMSGSMMMCLFVGIFMPTYFHVGLVKLVKSYKLQFDMGETF